MRRAARLSEGGRSAISYLESSAVITPDSLYRYALLRRLARGPRHVLFVGLNPSTADEHRDDVTVRRCASFARSWEFDVLLMGNLYAYRCTHPADLRRVGDPIGRRNRATLQTLVALAELVICSWGACWMTREADQIAEWLLNLPNSRCLGANRDGSPRHPSRLRSDVVPQLLRRS